MNSGVVQTILIENLRSFKVLEYAVSACVDTGIVEVEMRRLTASSGNILSISNLEKVTIFRTKLIKKPGSNYPVYYPAPSLLPAGTRENHY